VGRALPLLFVVLAGCALPIIGAKATRSEAAALDGGRRAGPQPDRDECHRRLGSSGVAFRPVPEERASGVGMPIELHGPVGGIELRTRNTGARHELLDCRLALALMAWAPSLRAAGVVRLEHYSMYRPGARVGGGGGAVSGHARGLAIDAARFHLADGAVLDVLSDWEERERGSRPCPPRAHEARPSRLLRAAVCAAVTQGLFQVVLTPHHDRAHADHVHLELKPDVTWTYVR
jgi:hypothetical protein